MIQLPPSKSIGARYLVATYFSGTLPADPIFQDNEDLMVLQQALLEVYSDEEPIDYGDSPIDVGASGTALRLLTAVCASSPGADYVITGSPRLMERPMTPLLDLLEEAGAHVETLGLSGHGPYRVSGNNIEGGDFKIRGDISSQFISALMLVAPCWEKGINLSFSSPLVSKHYIYMTSRLMEKFGIKVDLAEDSVKVSHGKYRVPVDFTVEADWSSAAFFYEAVALGAGNVTLENLLSPEISIQGDAKCDAIFSKLGVISVFSKQAAELSLKDLKIENIAIDFRDCPDLVLPFAVACLCRGVRFKFTGVAHLRLKESDRIDSLIKESAKLGFKLEDGEDSVEWNGETCHKASDVVIDPHDDHRVAMAFAISVFKFGEIKITHPEVVEKSFIDFWNQLSNLGVNCEFKDGVMIVRK